MKCKTCCFYVNLTPDENSIFYCVKNPPRHYENEYGNFATQFPRPQEKWWCGEWKPKSFIKMWPDNLIEDFN